MFLTELIIGTVLVGATVVIHAVALDRIMKLLERCGPRLYKRFKVYWKMPILIITVLCVFLAHILQIWLWAFFYYSVDALSAFEEALYFSASTFTTVGYGDVVLPDKWRLIGSFEAANGFIMFGWSTAFIFEVMSKLYRGETIRKT